MQLVSISGASRDVNKIYRVIAVAAYDFVGKPGVKPGTADAVVQELIRINSSMALSC